MIRELPTSEEVGFLIHRPDSIPAHPKRRFPAAETFSMLHVGKAGYGGLDLQRLVFGLFHPYAGDVEEAVI